MSDLERLDRALLRLRRTWDAPAGIEHEGRTVEGSTLLVCLAVEEHDRAGADVGVTEVAGTLGVTHSTASRLVSRSAAAGMVARRPHAGDPRRVSLSLTAEGARLVTASRAFRTARLRDALGSWPEGEVGTLADLLTRFAEAMAPDPGARRR
ncbi:DNA-binding transcriptional regulator, MarR family [Blastococcus sp. DSM 46786]|uniref:MarR family winged helix-turn-helix transcriptional regulator n=1 Tax=Blastococcus sp. DSM 46786 TaxID=1798227 RepID=UPI0008D05B44|nr:MarR family winged helix-turn-helix transcriptional regulator [Blastococcus sp. DSM 46786]SEL81628.1 DNA-binding transcriptional regulator, MarR family [Blastococcus sp. DSM 46786]